MGFFYSPALAQRVRDADVLLVIGDRLSEITTAGYTLLTVPDPAQALIHATPDAEELGRVYTPALGITASPDMFARALSASAPRLIEMISAPLSAAARMAAAMSSLQQKLAPQTL